MPKFNNQLTMRLARLLMRLGNGADLKTNSEACSAGPSEEENMIQFRIPIDMIRGALERKRQQEPGEQLPTARLKKPSGVRFALPVMRVVIPLGPRDELYRQSEAHPASGGRDGKV